VHAIAVIACLRDEVPCGGPLHATKKAATLIVRELLEGPRRIIELRSSPGISAHTLTHRPKSRGSSAGAMCSSRAPSFAQAPPRVVYELSAFG